MPGKPRPPGPLTRFTRLWLGHSDLRRSTDRAEGLVALLLIGGFFASVAVACLLGVHVDQGERADAARLHPAVAVLTRSGPSNSLGGFGQVRATWRAPGGQRRTGLLNTVTAPNIWDAPAGTRIPIFVTSSGTPVTAPSGLIMTFNALLAGFCTAGCSAVVLTISFLLCRAVLGRRRMRDWESAWAATGPHWTSFR